MTSLRDSRILRTIPLLIAVCVIDIPAQAKYSGGMGEPNDPYQIARAADLIALGETPEDYDKHFILTADIDLDPNLPGRKVFDRAAIAPDTNDLAEGFQGTPFMGSFDGDSHTISHLKISGVGRLGLFGQLDSTAEVRNLGVVDVSIAGSGGAVGGFVGYCSGQVTRCYSTGTVRGMYAVGGLAGANGRFGALTDCYSTAAVRGESEVGGLVGEHVRGLLTRCYSTGAVSGEQYVGGLAGLSYYGTERSCLWDTETSGQTQSAGGTGKTTAEMQTASTFLEAGWDFINVWGIGENQTYPYLRKYSAADINQDGSVNFLDLAVFAENWLAGVRSD